MQLVGLVPSCFLCLPVNERVVSAEACWLYPVCGCEAHRLAVVSILISVFCGGVVAVSFSFIIMGF